MAHITVMVFALLANLLIAGMVMTEGTRILTQLTEGKCDINQRDLRS